MKTQFRIREETRTENGEKISRFYCEYKFLWWWLNAFPTVDSGGVPGPDWAFSTKEEAIAALREHLQKPKVEFHPVDLT